MLSAIAVRKIIDLHRVRCDTQMIDQREPHESLKSCNVRLASETADKSALEVATTADAVPVSVARILVAQDFFGADLSQ